MLITLLLVLGALVVCAIVFALGYGAGYFNGVLGLRPDER